jgi:integrase
MVIHVHQGKGGKDRVVMLARALLVQLRGYWMQYRPDTWLFPGRHPRQPIAPRTVQKVCASACQRAGITKPVTVHTLRHGFATHLLDMPLTPAVADAPLVASRHVGHSGTTIRKSVFSVFFFAAGITVQLRGRRRYRACRLLRGAASPQLQTHLVI